MSDELLAEGDHNLNKRIKNPSHNNKRKKKMHLDVV